MRQARRDSCVCLCVNVDVSVRQHGIPTHVETHGARNKQGTRKIGAHTHAYIRMRIYTHKHTRTHTHKHTHTYAHTHTIHTQTVTSTKRPIINAHLPRARTVIVRHLHKRVHSKRTSSGRSFTYCTAGAQHSFHSTESRESKRA